MMVVACLVAVAMGGGSDGGAGSRCTAVALRECGSAFDQPPPCRPAHPRARRQQGLEPVGADGELFDPNLHEAVMREDRDDVPDGTVTAVFQRGYRLGDLLVRPALVRVASC